MPSKHSKREINPNMCANFFQIEMFRMLHIAGQCAKFENTEKQREACNACTVWALIGTTKLGLYSKTRYLMGFIIWFK